MNTTLIHKIKTSFQERFKKEPLMIFSPGRINIIGEHTDYNDGFVFPAAVNKGIVAAIQTSDTPISTAFAVDKDQQVEFSINNLRPIAEGSWENYVFGVISEIQNRSKTIGNFNIAFGGDIPGGAGMSSSAALENSVVFGLNELFNLGLSKHEMILISQKAEHNYVGVKCGIMDHVILLDCQSLEYEYVPFNHYVMFHFQYRINRF